MICHVMHFEHEQQKQWGVLVDQQLYPLSASYPTTAYFIEHGREAAYRLQQDIREGVSVGSVDLAEIQELSPVTSGRVLCQGANYRQHMIDSGMNPDDKKYNMFFTKSSASVCPGSSDIVRPTHIELLDYEVELGLVIGQHVSATLEVNKDNLHQLVAGIVITNDVSARDIQFSQSQFYKSKSYRTFCPVGPVLCLLQQEDMHYLDELQLELKVNGETRQQDSSANLVFKPAETLSEFSQVGDLDIGDLVLTGTPHGCALQISPSFIKQVYSMPEDTKWEFFKTEQKKNGRYLEPGDELTLTIKSDDGKLDLGMQKNQICSPEHATL